MACFWADGKSQEGSALSVSLEWRTGIATKDWESVARKEKIEVKCTNNFYQVVLQNFVILEVYFVHFVVCKGVELELAKLEGMVEAIRENLNYLKDRLVHYSFEVFLSVHGGFCFSCRVFKK